MSITFLFSIFLTAVLLCYSLDALDETEIVLKTYEAEEVEGEDYGEHIHEPWEEEVEELVNWANTLDSDILDI